MSDAFRLTKDILSPRLFIYTVQLPLQCKEHWEMSLDLVKQTNR